MQIGYRSDENIREAALEILRKYHPNDTIPIPIESIIEFDLELDIIPVPNLHKNHGIDGALSQDFSQIYVDDYAFENWPNRHRFTLAHEVGHYVLHKSDLENGEINTVEDWLDYAKEIAGIGNWFETQAHTFAGYILIPPHHLESQFNRFLPEIEKMIQAAKNSGIERARYLDGAVYAMAAKLSEVFYVSESAAKVRILRQRLDSRIP